MKAHPVRFNLPLPYRAYFFVLTLIFAGCGDTTKKKDGKPVPVIGFVDYVEDATLATARKGFLDALNAAGYSEDSSTLEVIYRNAQGDQPTMLQSIDFIISRKPLLIATNPTLATVSTVQRNKTIPVFMMVSPRPDLAGLSDASGKYPGNLYGVYETPDYIDTSVSLVHRLFPNTKKIGAIYSESEVQSTEALRHLQNGCKREGLTLTALPVSNSSETQLITQSLLAKGIDVFFALPDNVIFSSFESIYKVCDERNIPIITSESGLVARGAVASFGADMYQWGFQAGEQAATFLKTGSTNGLQPELVRLRNKLIHQQAIEKYKLVPDSTFRIIP